MRKLVGTIGALLILATTTLAHPSWGIVVDAEGTIYFVDVTHNGDGTLWKYDPDTEKLTPLRKWFHAHNLTLNADQEMHSAIAIWRTGEIEGEGHNYLFQYYPETDQLDTLLFTDDWDLFHGGQYALSHTMQEAYFPMDGELRAHSLTDGTTRTIPFPFERISTLATGPNGYLWISDSRYKDGTILRWSPETGFEVVITNFFPEDRSNALFENRNHQIFYGLGFSEHCNLLVGESVERALWEVTGTGEKIRRYQSPEHWMPTGVYYRDGKYYVMEYGFDRGHLGPRIVILDRDFEEVERLAFSF